MTANPERASLLGLPTELRLIIYQHVYGANLTNGKVVDSWNDVYGRGEVKSVPCLSEEKLTVPWLGLTLACKKTASELRSAMSQPGFLNSAENTTYSLNLHAMGHRNGMQLSASSWKRLPCAPEQARFLVVHFDANTAMRTWGSGAPNQMNRGLFQVMNLLVHCGPRFDSHYPLAKPMHIDEMSIIIETGPAHGEHIELSTEAGRKRNAESTFTGMQDSLDMLVPKSVLKTSIDRIRLEYNGKTLHWYPARATGQVPWSWSGYGYDWGLAVCGESEQSIEASK